MTRLTRLHQVAGRLGDDANATIEFYRDVLGARFTDRFDPPGLVFFDFSGVRLLLEPGATPAVLYFRVDDIHAAHRDLSARGVTFRTAPHCIHKDEAGLFDNPGTEEWMAFFDDPGGNTLALASRIVSPA